MSEGRKSVRWTAGGNILRSALATVQLLIVARFLSVADFGLVILLVSLLQLAQSISDAGLSSALIRFRDVTQNEKSSLYWLNVAVGFTMALMTIVSAPFLAHFYASPRLMPMLWIGSTLFIANGFYLQLRVLAERDLRFDTVIKVEVGSSSVGFLVTVALAVMNVGPYAVIWGQVATSISLLILAWAMLARDWRPGLHFAWSDVKRFVPYGLDMLLVNAAISFTIQLDLLIAGVYFTKQQFGSFGQPRDLGMKIMTAINPVISRVGLPLMAREQHDPVRVGQIYLRVVRMSSSVCFPVYAALGLLGADVLPAVLGERWRAAGLLLPYIALWFALRSSVNPLGTYMYALGKSRAALYYQLAFAALVAVAAFFGSRFGPVVLSLGMAAVYLVFIEVAWVAVLRPLSSVRFLDYHRQIIAPGASVIGTALAVLAVRSFGGAFIERTTLSLTAGGAVFLVLSVVFNRQGVDEIIGLVRSKRMQVA